MVCRVLGTLLLVVPLLGAASGCDNRPKIVLPTKQVPPPPRPAVAGGGRAQPAEPAPEQDKKETDSNKPPANPAPPDDKK